MKKENVIGTYNTPSPALRASSPSRGEGNSGCFLPPWRGKVGEAQMRGITHGFTLIELLVVVLIIGILAAVALPQYQKAVEKARLTETLQNINAIEKCFALYQLEHGGPASGSVLLKDLNCPIETTLGEWHDEDDQDEDLQNSYTSDHFQYWASCSSDRCYAESAHIPNKDYVLSIRKDLSGNQFKNCYTNETEMGRYICNSLKNQGWTYQDYEL